MTTFTTSVRDERGAIMVESAATIGLYLLLILMGCELLRLGYNVVTSQFIASRAMRQAILGSAQDGVTRGGEIEDRLIESAAQMGLDLGSAEGNNSQVTVCTRLPSLAQMNPCTGADADDAGTEGELIYIHIHYPLRLLFGLGTYVIDVTVFGKNEPFLSV